MLRLYPTTRRPRPLQAERKKVACLCPRPSDAVMAGWRVEETPVWVGVLDARAAGHRRACEKELISTQKRATLEPLPSAVADEQTLSRSLVHVVFEGAGIIHAEQPPARPSRVLSRQVGTARAASFLHARMAGTTVSTESWCLLGAPHAPPLRRYKQRCLDGLCEHLTAPASPQR